METSDYYEIIGSMCALSAIVGLCWAAMWVTPC
jgi:hypothetical protein